MEPVLSDHHFFNGESRLWTLRRAGGLGTTVK
jgi:hypothetical protein